MTREEAIKEIEILKEDYWDGDGYGHETKQYDDTMLALDMAIKALEQESKSEWQKDHEILKAYSDGVSEVLDKIRAEIAELDNKVCQQFLIEDVDKEVHHAYQDCLGIIDKYKAEKEVENGNDD